MAAKKPAKKPATKAAKKPAAKKPSARRPAAKKAAKTPVKPKTATRKASARPAAKIPPRADKGEGEPAVQARIATLAEPARSILARLHPLIMKHGKGLAPTVKWGFAVYTKDGKMLLVAAPRKNHVSFGYTMDAGIKLEPIEYTSASEIDEAAVARIVKTITG